MDYIKKFLIGLAAILVIPLLMPVAMVYVIYKIGDELVGDLTWKM